MLETFLSVLFVFLILVYALRLFFRYGLPWLLSRHMRKQQQKYYDFFGWGDARSQAKKSEGDVEVKNARTKPKKDDAEFGEYVDFEDVDE